MNKNNPLEKLSDPSQAVAEEKLKELLEKLREPSYLPTHENITAAFRRDDGSIEEWHDFCHNPDNPIYEFLNEEFLGGLSDYLSKRVVDFDATTDSPVVILEVGAGNGRLSHFLGKKLQAKAPGKFKIIPTDSGEWGLKAKFPVERIDHQKALEKYKPQIIISSWMPSGKDLTHNFRATPSVGEYILIGETDNRISGDEWQTWGIPVSSEDEGKDPPYLLEGFKRIDLEDISRKQICRTDQPGMYGHSRTTSFRRKK